MRTLKPLIITLYIILIVMMLLHTVLSFCGCVIVESGSYLNIDILSEPSQSTKDLLGAFVLLATLARITLILPRQKVCHVIGWLLSLLVSVITSSYVWIQNSVLVIMTGLFWTNYDLTLLGQWVIYLSWAITVFHAVIVGLLCRPEDGQVRKRTKGIALCISIIIGILLLIIFRDIITDWIRGMFRGLY